MDRIKAQQAKELQRLENGLDQWRQDKAFLETELKAPQGKFSKLDTDHAVLKEDVSNLRARLKEYDNEIERLRNNMIHTRNAVLQMYKASIVTHGSGC